MFTGVAVALPRLLQLTAAVVKVMSGGGRLTLEVERQPSGNDTVKLTGDGLLKTAYVLPLVLNGGGDHVTELGAPDRPEYE
jgi:hypothetical protein